MSVEAPTAPTATSTPAHRHSQPKRRLPLWITVIGWIIVAGLAVVAGMRIFAWDHYDLFAILNSVTAFVYLPAWIVAVVALVGRRYVLAVSALLIVVAQIVFVLPELTAAEPVPSWALTAPSVRLFDANVYASNPSMAGYAQEIKAYQPQLVTLEEAIPPDVTQLKSSGALANLPYTVQIKRYDPYAFFVASEYPLTDVHVDYLFNQPLIVKMSMQLPSGPQEVWVVHSTGPVPQSFSMWSHQVEEINRQVRQRGSAGLLLAGDFNSTWGNKWFRQILGEGMTDGAAARARPFEMTWSQTKPIIPPAVRIDHVLTGSGVAVTTIATGNGPGSDHRDLQATVAFHH